MPCKSMNSFKPCPPLLPALMLLASITQARADAIDGDWCHATLNLNIQGPKIRIPSGAQITGDYDRHGFRYTVPANESGGGTKIVMVLQSDELMQLTRGSEAPEMWKRCKPTS